MYAQKTVTVERGTNVYNFATQFLAQGSYYIKIVASDGSFTSEVTKLTVVKQFKE